MSDQSDAAVEDLEAFFAALDQARAEANAAEAAFVARMHAQQEQLAAGMPRLLEETFGITLPDGVHFEWRAD